MTIKEVEKKLNISRANIRFYEKEGLLEPVRNDNEYRNYSESDLKRLENILLFRKCNISIENIRLIFNGVKNIDEVFKEQIDVIENEVKALEGAKAVCKKLAQDKSSIDKFDTDKYINMITNEEQKGNKFYNIAEDYILATEKLYQSIIENEKFLGGEKMKKGIKIGLYAASSALLFLCLILIDLIFDKSINWADSIVLTAVFTVADVIGVKKYIENKTGEKFTRSQNLKHFLTIILVMIIALFGYYSIKEIYVLNHEPNSNVLEMSVKKSLISKANEEFLSDGKSTYAESHKILDYNVKNDEIHVYLVANYGLFSKNENTLKSVDSKKEYLTLVYKKKKDESGAYELKYFKNELEDETAKLKDVNFEDKYFENQLRSYFVE